MSRRYEALSRSLLVVAAAGLVAGCGGSGSAFASEPPPPAQQFVSRPDLRPVPVTVLTPAHGTAPGYVFVAPNGAQLAKIGDLIDAGVVKVPEVRVMGMSEAAAAQDENQKRHVRGKVALRFDL